MSYVDQNLNYILNKIPPKTLKRRSEGRLKTYNSSEDLRSWNFTVEDRRRQILDVVKSDIEKCGQLSAAILQALSLQSKTELARNLKKLWNFFMSRNQTPQKMKQLLQLQKQMGYVSLKAIQGCMCVGYYDLVCVCDDENYFKHRNNLLEMTQTMQDKLDKNEHFFEDKLPEEKKPCACTTSDGVQHSKISPRAATLPDSSYEGSLVVHPRIKAKEFEYADKNEGFEVTTAEKGLITAIPKTNIVCQYDMNSVKCTAFQTESDLVNKATGRSEPISKYVVKGTSTSPLPLGYTRSVKVEAISQDTENTSEAYRDIQDKLKALEYVCQEQKDNIKNFQKEQAALERQIQETTRSDQQRETCGALANKVKILERRLAKYSDIAAKDLETSKNNSLLIDNMLAEREEVQKKMQQMNELETQLVEYKKKATKAEELREQLRTLQKENSPYYDTKKIQSRCVGLESELESVTAERDALQKKFDMMQDEMDSLRAQAKEVEVLLVERDKLQIKLNDLIHVQIDYENLQLKCKYLENLAKERNMYKQQYESQLNVKCENESLKAQVEAASVIQKEKDLLKKQVMDLQSYIIDQENNAKMLLKQIDGLIKNKDEIQSNMNKALANMRAEIQKKDNLIASADIRLNKMQSELKNSIEGVFCETSCYKAKVKDLQNELNAAREHIARLERISKEKYNDIKKSKVCELAAIRLMRKELKEANRENETLQEIANEMAVLTGKEQLQQKLKKPECAVRRVAEALSQQYYEWDQLNKERRRSKSSCSQNCKRIRGRDEKKY